MGDTQKVDEGGEQLRQKREDHADIVVMGSTGGKIVPASMSELDQRMPLGTGPPLNEGAIQRRDVLGGIIHSYYRQAA
ncbi:MAG: hypothetical protein GY759_08800 [Chloroflexi bacterium]|nr:hypothetical protein [Chloroflexota bacterium]